MCQGWGAGMVRSRSLIQLHWVIFPVLLPCCFPTHISHQSAFALVVGSITCTAGRAVWANPVLATPAPCTVLGGLGCFFSTSSCKPSIHETKKYPNPTQKLSEVPFHGVESTTISSCSHSTSLPVPTKQHTSKNPQEHQPVIELQLKMNS